MVKTIHNKDIEICLFCGNDKVFFVGKSLLGGIIVTCGVCKAAGPQSLTAFEAVERWNTRQDDLAPLVTDGLGNVWDNCTQCGRQLQVVRPGKAQCYVCG